VLRELPLAHETAGSTQRSMPTIIAHRRITWGEV